jgi:hypothetical protein
MDDDEYVVGSSVRIMIYLLKSRLTLVLRDHPIQQIMVDRLSVEEVGSAL